MRVIYWFVGTIRRPQPGVKVDYASYLRAPPRQRAWMHASGAIVVEVGAVYLPRSGMGDGGTRMGHGSPRRFWQSGRSSPMCSGRPGPRTGKSSNGRWPSPGPAVTPSMSIPVVFSEKHRLHVPDGEIWMGVRIAGTELPARCELIAARLRQDGYPFFPPDEISTADLMAVHTPELVDFLSTAWERWQGSSYPDRSGSGSGGSLRLPVERHDRGSAAQAPGLGGSSHRDVCDGHDDPHRPRALGRRPWTRPPPR